MRTDIGLAVGGTYALVPGVSLFASYLYGQRHELGNNFVGTGPATAFNNTHGQAFAIGTAIKW
ncbi:MAG: porin, partial [Rhodospirillales bacterium]|nr:porin [Rhodospirillales bacterium]